VDRHCLFFCLYYFYIFRENLRFFSFPSCHFFFPFSFSLFDDVFILCPLWVTWRSA
jgi:hypothetical protein